MLSSRVESSVPGRVELGSIFCCLFGVVSMSELLSFFAFGGMAVSACSRSDSELDESEDELESESESLELESELDRWTSLYTGSEDVA